MYAETKCRIQKITAQVLLSCRTTKKIHPPKEMEFRIGNFYQMISILSIMN
jgi:hypothetical protein